MGNIDKLSYLLWFVDSALPIGSLMVASLFLETKIINLLVAKHKKGKHELHTKPTRDDVPVLMCYVSTWFNAWSMEAIAFCIAVTLLLIITLISFSKSKTNQESLAAFKRRWTITMLI
ncbi:MAG: hypothetical protein R3B55_01295 [Candidatus Paceibacterota bacterium]